MLLMGSIFFPLIVAPLRHGVVSSMLKHTPPFKVYVLMIQILEYKGYVVVLYR